MFTQASNIKLPESVTTLEANILFNADTQKLEIGSNIQTINISAFTSANNLREVIINKVDDGSLTGSPWANPYGARAIIWKK